MKARTGFVSNSSTASFVLLGFEVDIEELEERLGRSIYKIENELGIDFEYGSVEGGLPPDVSGVAGKYVFYIHSDDYGCNPEMIDLDKLRAEVEAIREKLNSDKPIKLWAGMRMA